MVGGIKKKVNNLKVNWVNTSNIDFVTVRKYEGVESNRHVWTFLGYDIVEKIDNIGRSLTLDEIDYDYLEKVEGTIGLSGKSLYNHDGIKIGDIRIKSDELLDGKTIVNHVLENNYKLKFGVASEMYIPKKGVRAFASNSDLSFYKNKQYIKK